MGTWKGDSNPGGPGGRTRKIQTNVPRGRTSHGGGGGQPPTKKCCPMNEAIQSARRGQFRLARRYARMSVRVLVARVV